MHDDTKASVRMAAVQKAAGAIKRPSHERMKEKSTVSVGPIELDALRAAAAGARVGLDCLLVTLGQAAEGRLLTSMAKEWFRDYEKAMETYNSVAEHTIIKES